MKVEHQLATVTLIWWILTSAITDLSKLYTTEKLDYYIETLIKYLWSWLYSWCQSTLYQYFLLPADTHTLIHSNTQIYIYEMLIKQ